MRPPPRTSGAEDPHATTYSRDCKGVHSYPPFSVRVLPGNPDDAPGGPRRAAGERSQLKTRRTRGPPRHSWRPVKDFWVPLPSLAALRRPCAGACGGRIAYTGACTRGRPVVRYRRTWWTPRCRSCSVARRKARGHPIRRTATACLSSSPLPPRRGGQPLGTLLVNRRS